MASVCYLAADDLTMETTSTAVNQYSLNAAVDTYMHCVPERRPPFYFLNNSQKLTDFNNFGNGI